MLARVKSVGEGGGFLGTAGCSGETVYCPLHGEGVEAMLSFFFKVRAIYNRVGTKLKRAEKGNRRKHSLGGG